MDAHTLYAALTLLRTQGKITDRAWTAIEDADGEYAAALGEAEELYGKDLEGAITKHHIDKKLIEAAVAQIGAPQ
jgi:phage I-like protein